MSFMLTGLILLFAYGARGGSNGGLVFRSWSTAAGLPQNTINAIVQDQTGYLWLATRDGLARFDGVRFTVFGLRDGLRSVDIQTVFEDRGGTLWIGTSGGGLCRMANGKIEPVPFPSDATANDSITALTEDTQGRLWVGTRAGLLLLEQGRPASMPELAEVARTQIRALLTDRRGTVWIANSRGLYEYRDGHLIVRPGPENENVVAHCLLEDRTGRFWVSIGNGVMLCRHEGAWSSYTQTNGVPFSFVSCLAEGADGTVWAGSLDAGLYYFQDDHFYAVRKEDGLSADDIRSLNSDREGNLWIGTRTGGLDRLTRSRVMPVGASQGLTNEFTRGVSQSPDGTIWVGTTGGGIYQGSTDGFTPFRPDPAAFFYAHVDPVLVATDGTVWWGGGGVVLRWQQNRLDTFTNEPWMQLGGATALLQDGPGSLWVGTSVGKLAHLTNGTFAEFPARVARGAITGLARDSSGILWVGSIGGGLRQIHKDGSVMNLTNGLPGRSVQTLYLDANGPLWIATGGGGLSRYKDGAVFNFTSQQGFPQQTISQIVEDDFGSLWLGGSRGILQVPKSELNDVAAGRVSTIHPRRFGINEGMPAEECSTGFFPGGLKTKTGLICFSTVKGLVFLDPRQQETNAAAPIVLIEEIALGGTARTIPITRSVRRPGTVPTPEPSMARISIPAGIRDVEFRYTGLSFASPEKVTFRYQLVGWDKDWVDAGTRRSVRFNHVSPGNYTFRVVAGNSDNVWATQSELVPIRFEYYFWETRTFRVAVLFVALALVGLTLRYFERLKFKRQLAQLQTRHAIEKERLRISQDMHDNLGAILTQVSQLSDLGEGDAENNAKTKTRFEQVGSHARSAVQALDEIVWATNPINDSLPRFADYLSRFADEFFESTAIRCWQEVPTDLPSVPLRADIRHDVFSAAKEAFNNVARHSGATEVWLRMKLENEMVYLEIEDNGHGFDPARARHGNGLNNIRTRMAENGGSAEIISAESKGTRVRMRFPLNPQTNTSI